MFDKLFKQNIKSTMNWNDSQFDMFYCLWKDLHYFNVTSTKKAFMCTEAYFELILSLFFITLQTDLKEEHKEKKSILLCVLLFYSASEELIGKQSEESLNILSEFLLTLVDKKLIPIPCLKYTLSLLHSFNEFSSDSIKESDRILLSDLIISSDPIVVNRKHAMFYYDIPQESMFAVKKPYPTPVDFFDAMFNTSRQIQSKMLRGFYVERLNRLMDTQAKKSIFPF